MSIPDLILRVIGKADGDTAHIDHDKFAHGDDEYQGLFEAIASYFANNPMVKKVNLLITGDE